MSSKHIPWVEKYRPKSLSDIVQQSKVVKILEKSQVSGHLPHLLFYGPPGTGKTSTILALAKELYGKHHFSKRVKELNSSNDRGISIVRNQIKQFASFAPDLNAKKSDGTPLPPYKLIILDEADAMTISAQAALRRTMENYSSITRFCLICNYVSKIADPIASRCASFRFTPIPIDSIIQKLESISESEKCSIDPEAILTIARVSGGDLRKSITLLQSCHQYGNVPKITSKLVNDFAASVDPDTIQSFLNACCNETKIKNVLHHCKKKIASQAFPVPNLLESIHQIYFPNPLQNLPPSPVQLPLNPTDDFLAQLAPLISITHYRLVERSDELLQLYNFASQLFLLFQAMKKKKMVLS